MVPKDADTQDDETGGLFDDPEGYYPPTPPPTTQTHKLLSGQTVTLHLVGHSPLEAHHLWNGSKTISNWFETHEADVKDKTVLELGAAAGLPSIVCAALGAKKVIVTDFPDPDLVANMQKNIDICTLLPDPKPIVAQGYVWGADTVPLLDNINPESGFDILILADLLFRHSEHGHLLDTVQGALKKTKDSKALVFFTSYRPWLKHKDMAFFDLARERGFVVEKLLDEKLERPLFENDPGDVDVQKTVTGWSLTWP
ncbi:putative nicotinamide n-methyltransferase protein [Zalerion maritima]|uniref:Protein N-terminal and lysine N-methyltransferase EFM7 n=1 Tax=Zalerion maritima TaxID=339359 RepID=A0AAD5RZK4_9PEZI|nr:putative nicotinamide n-methyltransferase protein [Zalerion maritima]